MAIGRVFLLVAALLLFIGRISLAAFGCALAPYLRAVPEPERRERVRAPVPVAFAEFVIVEAPVDRAERRRLEAILLRERAVEVRRVPAAAAARRVRERVVEALVPRSEVVRRRVGLPVRLADPRAGRELDLRMLVAIGLASCGVRRPANG